MSLGQRRAVLALTSLVVSLAVGEFVARRIASAPPIARPGQFADLLVERHRVEFEELFVADDRRFWKLAPGTSVPTDRLPLPGLIANSAGLREAKELPAKKGDNEIRILFVGDSTTFGYRLPHDASFVDVTEQLLRARETGLEVECINAGVPGYSLFQGARFLEDEGWGYEPDLVVLGFGWNGAESWDGRGDLATSDARGVALPPPPLDRLQLTRLLWNVGRSDRAAPQVTSRPRLMPYEFAALLEEISAAAASHGSELLLLVGPGRSNLAWTPTRDYRTPLQEIQYAFGDSHPFDGRGGAIDLVPIFQKLAEQRPAADWMFDDVHPTAAGHRAIAEVLTQRLAPWVAGKRR